MHDPFHARSSLDTAGGPVTYYRLAALEEAGLGRIARLPYSIRVLLEAALRKLDGFAITETHVRQLADWPTEHTQEREIPFMPARVILQDFTGVPAVVDLAALRSAMARAGGDPAQINPRVPVDLVIDHSVQVDAFGSLAALFINADREFERNRERYEFLRWGQSAFDRFRVVPPSSGIVHQVNLEYLASVVATETVNGEVIACPDTLVGTDSHTTMINGLGVVGWGVGGIEAEAVMLGQPLYMLMPSVVGMKLTGRLPEGATATDLVLTITEKLRAHGVVGKFVEYYGDGLAQLGLADRATIANMAPEYGATMGFFPVDGETLAFLARTGRSAEQIDLVERYCRAQGLFHTAHAPEPVYSETLALDLATVEPSLAGPKRPQDRVALSNMKRSFWAALRSDFGKDLDIDPAKHPEFHRWLAEGGQPANGQRIPQPNRSELYRDFRVPVEVAGVETNLTHGSVVIAAITSCTNTSNPSVMVAAGLLARKAVERGLSVKPWVKTSMAPGSRVVTRYLEAAGLSPYLQALRFHTVGYGCTTCIGNSGPLPEPVAQAITENGLVVASVLSGNRNFEGRINPLTRANYLASPPLVVAYALAGTVDIDMTTEPLGLDANGAPVYLADIWPSQAEINATVADCLRPEMFGLEYDHIFDGDEQWRAIGTSGGAIYDWRDDSTYIQEPPFFGNITPELPPPAAVRGARALALLGDSITTDHISPAGSIAPTSPAAEYLMAHGVERRDFNSYGSRRGSHDVMMRGTFANVRLKNHLAPGTEGGFTTHLPTGEVTSIYDAAMRYQAAGTPLVVLAGKEYGTGSSRDWAAKGTYLLGVRAVIAESYERIHRSNLVGMGVLPLQFQAGESWQSLGLTGREVFDIELPGELVPGGAVWVIATASAEDGGGAVARFETVLRLDSPVDVRYYRNGGILHTVLREFLKAERVVA
jgi:aconitate hydratase